MTQQSLIARLRKVEEALEFNRAEYAEYMGFNNLGEPTTQHGYKLAVAALSDLRDLIREAEEQETARNITCEKCVSNECTCCADWIGGELYTALGEKS